MPSAPAPSPSSNSAIISCELGRARRAIFEPHHHQPQGVVADQHPGVDRNRGKRVEIFRKAHLAERQPRRPAAQIIGEQLRLARQDRRDREPAMADDLGRDALAHLAFGLGIDRQGEVRMRLDVDEAGRHRQALGIDHLGRAFRHRAAERGDPPVANRDIADFPGPPAAVDNRAAADQDVGGHGHGIPSGLRSICGRSIGQDKPAAAIPFRLRTRCVIHRRRIAESRSTA